MLKKVRLLDGAGCALATASDLEVAGNSNSTISRLYKMPMPTMFVFMAFPHCSNIALRRRG
eukprot:7535338-Lingulodinium_polyedra.AAC.1